MDNISLTDSQIEEFISEIKVVTNPRARWVEQRKSKRKNYDVESFDGKRKYTLYIRQNTILPDNFSCGLRLEIPGREPVTLVRYNGCDHPHENPLEGDNVSFKCHIHRATERYIDLGRKPEHFAVATDRYNNCNGALKCLVDDCKISGLTLPDIDTTRDLFDDN
ncbi:Uncharacterised protein [Metakosakonia massiliensis]|uniref:Uncharacterized protein n=1 Tax=Phytobacter massiliensis TaxID=1485952 RepID=A0A6N3EJK8_9ENTR